MLVSLLFVARPGFAQLVLMPGELRENIAAAGIVLQSTAPGDPSAPRGNVQLLTAVSFDRADELTQNIRLYAFASPVLSKSATARGILFVDFCVPRSGFTACDVVSDTAAPDITASVTFSYGTVGVVDALGPGAKAAFQASGSVIDLERSAYVNFQHLEDLSASLGSVKTIAGVPIPIPDFAGASVTLPVTFTTILKRGRKYRFQLAAASTAQGVATSVAESNFYNPSVQFPFQRGRVQLHNLTIQVSRDQATLDDELARLREVVTSLQGQVGNLAERIDVLGADVQDDISALRQDLFDLARRTDIPGSLLMVPAGSSAPVGYTFVGTFDLAPSGGSRGRPAMMPVDVYKKNPA